MVEEDDKKRNESASQIRIAYHPSSVQGINNSDGNRSPILNHHLFGSLPNGRRELLSNFSSSSQSRCIAGDVSYTINPQIIL